MLVLVTKDNGNSYTVTSISSTPSTTAPATSTTSGTQPSTPTLPSTTSSSIVSGLTNMVSNSIVLTFEDGTRMTNLNYRFAEGIGWQWSPDKTEWISVNKEPVQTSAGSAPTQKNIDFIKSLRGTTLKNGLNLLIARTITNNEGTGWLNPQFSSDLLTSDKTDFDNNGIFTVRRTSVADIYFRYNGGWQWSTDKTNWYSVSALSGSPETIANNYQLETSLQGQSYPNGIILLFYR